VATQGRRSVAARALKHWRAPSRLYPQVKGKPIDHSITLVGYGTDKTNGPYWIVKNSWSEKFGNDGFINVARGISCASIDCCGNTFVYGNASKYVPRRRLFSAAPVPWSWPLSVPHPTPTHAHAAAAATAARGLPRNAC